MLRRTTNNRLSSTLLSFLQKRPIHKLAKTTSEDPSKRNFVFNAIDKRKQILNRAQKASEARSSRIRSNSMISRQRIFNAMHAAPSVAEEAKLEEGTTPPFYKLNEGHIKNETTNQLAGQLFSAYRWTPLIQGTKPSGDFIERMTELRKVRGFDESRNHTLVENFLMEALKGTDFDYYSNYKCLPSKKCKFNGVVDFMIYKKTGNHLPLIPVILPKRKTNIITPKKADDFSECEAAGAAVWSLTNMQESDKNINETRVLQSTGHSWIMYEYNQDGEFKKTGVYSPNTDHQFKKIYDDPEMQEIILGLIQFASFIQPKNEIGLKNVCGFITGAKYIEESDDDTKVRTDDVASFWRYIPRGLQDLLVSSK